MLFIEYPKCTTCIKAKRYLESKKIEFVDRNIKIDNPTKEEIITWHKMSNLPIKKLFNTSGLLYKEYDLKNKLDNMSEEEMYNLLSTNGMLVKRPILVTNEKAIFGFKVDEWDKLIK